jgi:hypothetical protein
MKRTALLVGLICLSTFAVLAQDPPGLEGLTYDVPFFPGSRYDSSIPTLESVLGFAPGQRAATPQQIADAVNAWARASNRTKLVEYARTWENRPLYYIAISSPANIARLDEIRAGMQRLADPRGLSAADGDRLVTELPAVAWMAYSIHGNETSGGDAALELIYHLVAATDEDVLRMLDEMVILVDPLMNPDGRHRFAHQAAEDRGAFPNVDDQALLHSGYWPGGRGNHYLYDLNRDWILGINPESRGRIKAAGEWHPLFFLDAHEMGAQDTFLFSPAREPINANFPESTRKWKEHFARKKAGDFDRKGWLYYTGEWNDNWYPGYSDAWAQMRGSIGFLYEQARIAEDGVRRPNGTILSYRQSVHHQLLASWSNLKTLQENAESIKADFLAHRRSVLGERSPYASRTFAILPTKNAARINQLLDLLELQGIEVYRADREIAVKGAVDQLGRSGTVSSLPAGTLLIPNRQPEANLVATMFEFDPRMPEVAVAKERKELLAKGESTMYDATAWNLTMMYGLEAVTISAEISAGVTRVSRRERETAASPAGDAVAWIIDGADDASVTAAAKLMQRKVNVRVAERPFEFDGTRFSRGSVVVTKEDNKRFEGLASTVAEVAKESGVGARAATTGWGEGDLPDLGGGHFVHVFEPRIALLSRGTFSGYDVGTTWYTLDQKVGVRSSRIDAGVLGRADLRRYNVVVVPEQWRGAFDEGATKALGEWVEAGGTLVAIGSSAAALTKKEGGLSVVRQLPDVLDDLDPYRLTIMREWMASREVRPGAAQLWSNAVDTSLTYPWATAQGKKPDSPDKAELERRDKWQNLFMPQGAFLAARVDQEHWLTFGTGEILPILHGDAPVLMSKTESEAPVRFGVWEASKSSAPADSVQMAGWSALPDNQRLLLRMSGLLWPEAGHRLANSAWVTRERKGRGQIILIAGSPTFRGTTLGTMRIFSNAVVYGPGFGTRQVIEP